MGAITKIQWSDHTFNPWIGCTKVSPGCANCYAENETFARIRRARGQELWGNGAKRVRTSDANWRKPLAWNGSAVSSVANYLRPDGGRRRPRVFCASMADWLDAEVPIEWLADLLKLIHGTPNLDWLLLTKRPHLWQSRLLDTGLTTKLGRPDVGCWLHDWIHGKPPSNIWIGASIEDQQRANERIPKLLNIPAKVRFLSVEPILGPLSLNSVPYKTGPWDGGMTLFCNPLTGFRATSPCSGVDGGPRIHWVIFGGESGPKARLCNVEWIRDGVHQCRGAGVAPFVKQLGARPQRGPNDEPFERVRRTRAAREDGSHELVPMDPKGGDMDEWPDDLRVQQFPH